MGTLNGKQIKQLVRDGQVVIEPFDDDLVQPASYDLRLGKKVLASPLGPDELGRELELNKSNPKYPIQTGQMVAVMSKERIQFPLDICSNSFGIRSEFVRKGLLCFGGPHLDPGWRGHLIVSLQNIGPEPITLELDQPFFTITFDRLEESVEPGQGYPAEAPSSGPHRQDSGEAKIRESTAGVSRKPSSDGKARGSSSKHLCGLTAWNT